MTPRAKERFFQIYDALDIYEAEELYREWKKHLAPGVSEAFKPLATAMENWQSEIFNYFEHPVTNAYTECLNGLTLVINRMGRGYSFEALRAKVLFTASAHKIVKPKFQRERTRSTQPGAIERFAIGLCIGESTEPAPKPRNLGTDVSTLEKLQNEGLL